MKKIGIIGFGKMGRKHFDCYKRIPGVEVLGVYDVDTQKAREYGLKIFNDSKELIHNCDIVDVCTPTDTHKTYVIESINGKKPVFVEKPLCRTMKEADEIMKLAKKKKAKVMVGHIVRYFNQYIAIKRALDNKSIGRPVIARASRAAKVKRIAGNWFNSHEKSGGVILDLMIHDIDFLRWCFGDVCRVYAKNLGNNNQHTDYALALLRFKNGVIAHLEASWAHPGGFRANVEISGDAGLLHYDSRVPSALTVELNSGEVNRENPVDENANLVELKEFIDYVTENKKPRVSLEDAYKSLEVSLAALESAETGQVIQLK